MLKLKRCFNVNILKMNIIFFLSPIVTIKKNIENFNKKKLIFFIEIFLIYNRFSINKRISKSKMNTQCTFKCKNGNLCKLSMIEDQIYCKMHTFQNKQLPSVDAEHCTYKCKSGNLCKLFATEGNSYCKMHLFQKEEAPVVDVEHCTYKCKSGNLCKLFATEGNSYCKMHLYQIPKDNSESEDNTSGESIKSNVSIFVGCTFKCKSGNLCKLSATTDSCHCKMHLFQVSKKGEPDENVADESKAECI